MSSCKLQYIDDLALASQDEKDRLTKLHLDTARRINTHRVDNNGYVTKLFQFKSDKLIVPGRDSFYKEALAFIKIVNNDLGFDAVTLKEDPNNDQRHFVSIDVRPDQNLPIDLDTEQEMETFYKYTLGDSEILTGTLEFESISLNTEHAEVFKKLSESVQEKAKKYLGGLKSSSDYYRSGKTEKDLKFLLHVLKDDSTAGLIESVSKYITMSGFNLNNITQRLRVIDKKMKSLSADPTVRKAQLKEIADFTRHSSYFYHLFDLLEEMSNEFAVLGIKPRAIDNYERDLLERDIREMMEKEGVFEEQDILDFMNLVPSEIGPQGNLYGIYKQMYKDKIGNTVLPYERYEQLHEDFKSVLTQNLKKDGGFQQQLNNMLADLRPLKMDLKRMHYETLTEIYYPSFLKTFKGKETKLTIDGKQTLTERYMMSKKDFTTLLRLAEEDPDAIEKWGSAMINSSEVIAKTVANFFKEVMIDIDLTNKGDIRDMQQFLTDNGREQGDSVLQQTDQQATHFNNTIEAIEIVDDLYVPKEGDAVVEMTVLGITAKYRARTTKNYLNRYNNIAYQNTKKVFSHHVEDVADGFTDLILNDRYGLSYLSTSSDPILRGLHDMIYTTDATGTFLAKFMGRFFTSDPTREDVKRKLQNMLFQSFYREHLRNKNVAEVADMMEENGVTSNGRLVNLNDDKNFVAKRHVMENSSWNNYKVYTRGQITSSNLNDRFHFSGDSLFGVADKLKGAEILEKKVLVRFSDLTFGYVEMIRDVTGDVLLSNTSGKDIYQFATFSRDYTSLNDSYDIEKGGFGMESQNKWNTIQGDTFKRTYFNKIINLYKQANNNYVQVALQNREIPQVRKMEESSRLSKAKDVLNTVTSGKGKEAFMEYAGTYTVEEDKVALMKDGKYVDEEGLEVNDPIYISTERQYINGQKIRDVKARFNRPVPLDQLESDLYKGILMYKTASNVFRGLKNNESQALLLQTVLEGDSTIGIDPRKAKIKKYGKTVKTTGGGIKYKEHDLRSSAMMVSFINDYVFGISNEDFGIFGTNISAKKVAGIISGYTAYTALAWNVFTIPSNRLISLHNTKVVAEGNEFFNEKDWRSSIGIYHANLGNFLKDFKSKGFTNTKSPITQLLIRFDAIQGEFLSPTGIIHTKGVAEKMSDSAMMWTQEIGEHANQTETMIMLMKGYKLPSGVDLWKAVEDANVGRPEGQGLVMPVEFTRELEVEFQKRLQAVNRQVAGNYGKLDKNMMQKGIVTNMLMTFKKYIYDGFRSRFAEQNLDQEIRDEQEGYFRTYLKSMNEEFSEVAKTQGLTAALKSSGAQSLGRTLLKTTLGGWDAAFGRIVSGGKDSTSDIAKYLYGEKGTITDRQYYAAMKATYDIGNMVRAMLVIVAVEAIMSGLDDDDDELKFILSYVEIYSQKMESDIGLFTSFTNMATGPFLGGATLDQMYRLWKSPMAATRSIDTTTSIFKQLISFDAINEEGEFEFKWHALDQYEQSGDGYEKGDYKIARKFEKSIFSPIAQIFKLMSPEQQLEYLNMVSKYSK